MSELKARAVKLRSWLKELNRRRYKKLLEEAEVTPPPKEKKKGAEPEAKPAATTP